MLLVVLSTTDHVSQYCSMCYNVTMKSLSVRDMRNALSTLDELVTKEGEVLVTRRGKPIARVLPVGRSDRPPSHLDLRESMPHLEHSSEDLVRKDRDARG